MSFHSALTALAALNVAGVAHNYGISATPAQLTRAQLPALLVMPIEPQRAGLFREHGSAFEVTAFAGGARTIRASVTHLLVTAPVESGAGLRQHLTPLVQAMDAYVVALGADLTLGGSLLSRRPHVKIVSTMTGIDKRRSPRAKI